MDSLVCSDPVQRIAADLLDCVATLKENYLGNSTAIDDDDRVLHKFCAKLEYLLQSNIQETSFLGKKKNYWDFFHKGLTQERCTSDGIKFVKRNKEIKTPLGQGRALIRFCLVHQCLGDTLQRCFTNEDLTKSFYDNSSVFNDTLKRDKLLEGVYDLNEVKFDLSPVSADLDISWPTFARQVSNPHSSWHVPSRTMSISSLASFSSRFNESYSLPPEENFPNHNADLSVSFGGLEDSLGEFPLVRELKIKLNELTHEHETARELLNSEIQMRDEQIIGLKSLLEQKEREMKILSSNCENYGKSVVDDLEDQLEACRRDLDEVQANFTCCRAALELKSQNEEQLNQMVSLLQTRLPLDSNKNSSLEGDDVDRDKEFERVTAELGEKKIELAEKESKLEESRNKLREIMEKYSILKMESETVQAEISTLKFKLSEEALEFEESMKQQQNRNAAHVGELNDKLCIQDKVIGVLEQQLQSLRHQHEADRNSMLESLNQCNDLLKKKEAEYDDVVHSLRTLEVELGDKNTEIVGISERCLEKDNAIVHLKDELELLRTSLIELVRQKDKLWQANEKLVTLQKIRVDKWVPDSEVTQCSKCETLFKLMVRKHHCRLCGRIFCYSCSNNLLPTTANRECRVCDDCFALERDLKLLQTSCSYWAEDDDQPVVCDNTVEDNIEDFDVIKNSNLSEASSDNSGNVHPRWDDFYASEWKAVPVGEILAEDKVFAITVNAGSMTVLPIRVDVDDCLIDWEVLIELKCLGLMITYKSERSADVDDSTYNILLPCKRLVGTPEAYKGRLSTKKKLGLYKFHFDNTYSKMTSKTVKVKLRCSKSSPT